MDASEATKIVMSRIQSLDPENASKIMGYILIQDQGEKEMIRLAFSPDALLLSYINQAKARFALNHFRSNSPRIIIPNNNGGFNLTGPPSPFQRSRARPVNNGSGSPFYGGNDFSGEEFLGGGVNYQPQEELPFFDEPPGTVEPIMSPSGRSDSMVFPYGEDVNSPHPFHRRSCSVNDAAFLANLEEGGGGNGNGFLWRPCMYYARGFCKNGSSCKFLHGDNGGGEAVDGGSPSGVAGFDDLMKMKAFQQQQQRLAFMGHNPFAYNKNMDENLRGDLSPMGLGACASSSAQQIYLTFPADSTFKEEDVSNYFSMFGPVQDVRIPYQQKRMFGFVTFRYPETVKLILAKGNPHFVCDSRVLVKPYKEKGKVREKKHQHQLERGEYSASLSPSGIDSREHFDQPFGPRMLLSPQEMMLRKKLEQEVELQHAIELESQRMLRLQLRDLKAQNHNNNCMQRFPSGIQYSSPRMSQWLMNQHVSASSHSVNEDDSEELSGSLEAAVAADEKLAFEGAESSSNINVHDGNQLATSDDSDLHESFTHHLPDNLFASPTKSAGENQSSLAQASAEADDGMPSPNDTPLLPGGSPLTMASLKSCYLQMPRFSSGQEAIEM